MRLVRNMKDEYLIYIYDSRPVLLEFKVNKGITSQGFWLYV